MAPFRHRHFRFREFSTQKRVSSKSLKPFIKSVFMQSDKNYSTIVATLPDPTVRPPSRFYLLLIPVTNGVITVFLLKLLFIFTSFFILLKILGTKQVPKLHYTSSIENLWFYMKMAQPNLTNLVAPSR